MSFRNQLILTVFGVVLLIVGGVWLATTRVLENSAELRLGGEVDRDLEAVTELLKTRRSILEGEVGVVAAEPRLKAITSAQEVTHETVYGVAAELKKALGSDVFLLTDAEGALIVDVADPDAEGFDMSKDPLIAAALDTGRGSGVWTHESDVFLMQSHRLAFGKRTAGVLAVGYDVSESFLESAHRQTGGALALILDGRVVGTAMGEKAIPTEVLAGTIENLPEDGHLSVTLVGERFVAGARSLPGYRGDRDLRYAVFRSLDEAMAPAHKLIQIIAGLAIVGMFVGLVLAILFAQRLSRPLSNLVEFSKSVGRGELERRETAAGPVELRVLADAMNHMAHDLSENQKQLVAKERLEQEMEIARRVQLSILPKELSIPELNLAAHMTTASEVGGDYYDVIVTEESSWIGVGDVAGHGLPAGLVMVMVQSAVASLVRAKPQAKPSELVAAVNRVIYDNVRVRLEQKQHVTFSLLRYDGRGAFQVAGAHEDFIIFRNKSKTCERVVVEGTWIGMLESIEDLLDDVSFQLDPGDLLVLYTDGLIEARDEQGRQWDMAGIEQAICDHATQSVQVICDEIFRIVEEHREEQLDDETLVVIRYQGAAE